MTSDESGGEAAEGREKGQREKKKRGAAQDRCHRKTERDGGKGTRRGREGR